MFLLAIELLEGGSAVSKLLYAGPLDNAKVVFGVGRFQLKAEVKRANNNRNH